MGICNISFILNNHFILRYCTARDGRDTPVNFHCRRGLRRWSRFFYLVRGGIDFVSHTGKKISVSGGDVMFLPYDIEYTSAWTDSRDGYYYSVEFILENNDGENINLFDDITLLFNDKGSYKALFRDMVNTVTESAVGTHLKSMEKFMHLLRLIALRTKSTDGNFGDIQPAIEAIEESFNSETDVSALALLCHMSPATLRRRFQSLLKMSPVAYRNTLRLNKARELLLTGLYTVGESAERVGIDDLSYFSRLYKRQFGVSPLCSIKEENT